MFTEKAIKNADACRFCWMCRHVCPVGLVTGKEINNARPKGLLVSMEPRGIPLDEYGMGTMYECCLCKACTNDCVTGYDPPVYILEARTKAVVEDSLPKNVRKVLDRALEGSMYQDSPDEKLTVRIKELPEKAEVLFFIGEIGRRSGSKVAQAYMDLLEKAKINYTSLTDEPTSGAQLGELMGHVEDVRNRASFCMERLSGIGAKTVVVLDPTDCAFFKHECAEWGILPNLEFVTATEYMWNLIKDAKIVPGKKEFSATYHDPCRLARDLEETEPARKIMEAMGIKLKEMFLNRKLTKCCGGALLHQNYPEMSKTVTEGRWGDVSWAGEKMLVTACPACAVHFQDTVPKGMESEDLFILLNSVC